MDDFEQMWQISEREAAPVEEDTPEYQIRDGIAKYKLLADLLKTYYHAKHGMPLEEQIVIDEQKIQFQLSEK